jgi:hypothetical protein
MAQRSVAKRVGLTRRRVLALAALPLAACGPKRSPDLPPPPAADAFDWNAFLKQWSDESLSLLRSLGADYGFDAERRLVERASARFDGASEAAIDALERRIGRRLPPSYRTFLATSDGLLAVLPGGSLVPAKDVRMLGDAWPPWLAEWTSMVDIGVPGAASPPIAGARMPDMLVVSDDPENLFEAMLLDPAAIGGDGEWRALFFNDAAPGATPYGSFRQMMIATRAQMLASLRDIAAGERRSRRH